MRKDDGFMGQRGSWLVLAVVLVGSFMAVLDTTIVNVGRLGDRFGYKPLFLAGLSVFTPASLGCGLASGPLVPLVEGRAAGWPVWTWLSIATCLVMGAVLGWWEVRLHRRGGEPVIQVDLVRRRSFAAGQLLALFYFAGFTSLFFTLSIAWQQGLGRSALATGVLVVPFAVCSLTTASLSDKFSHRLGSWAIRGGIAAMLAGQALLLLLALYLSLPNPSGWVLVGPLALAGLGSGMVSAPNQDFVLGSVPKSQAGTAGGALITAQRLGAAIGIAVIGTVLFGGSSSSGSSGGGGQAKVMPMLTHSAQWATGLNLLFVIAALICAFFLPATLGAERAAENA